MEEAWFEAQGGEEFFITKPQQEADLQAIRRAMYLLPSNEPSGVRTTESLPRRRSIEAILSPLGIENLAANLPVANASSRQDARSDGIRIESIRYCIDWEKGKISEVGWGARDRTWEWRDQKSQSSIRRSAQRSAFRMLYSRLSAISGSDRESGGSCRT
jgi:hypothetical protein